MSQRGIDERLLDLVKDFGVAQERGDVEKYILNRKSLDESLRRLDRIRSRLVKARDKGGLVLVSGADGTEITTYRLDSYSRQKGGRV
jgi:hypothetical protein